MYHTIHVNLLFIRRRWWARKLLFAWSNRRDICGQPFATSVDLLRHKAPQISTQILVTCSCSLDTTLAIVVAVTWSIQMSTVGLLCCSPVNMDGEGVSHSLVEIPRSLGGTSYYYSNCQGKARIVVGGSLQLFSTFRGQKKQNFTQDDSPYFICGLHFTLYTQWTSGQRLWITELKVNFAEERLPPHLHLLLLYFWGPVHDHYNDLPTGFSVRNALALY